MDEIEILSLKDVKDTIEKSSLEDLIEYRRKLEDYILEIDNEITNRKDKKYEAETIFKYKEE